MWVFFPQTVPIHSPATWCCTHWRRSIRQQRRGRCLVTWFYAARPRWMPPVGEVRKRNWKRGLSFSTVQSAANIQQNALYFLTFQIISLSWSDNDLNKMYLDESSINCRREDYMLHADIAMNLEDFFNFQIHLLENRMNLDKTSQRDEEWKKEWSYRIFVEIAPWAAEKGAKYHNFSS